MFALILLAAWPSAAAVNATRAVAPDQSVANNMSFALLEHRQLPRQPLRRSKPNELRSWEPCRSGVFVREAEHVRALATLAEIRHDLPRGLLDALIQEESGYNRHAVSRRGAMGFAQLMPTTARMLGVVNPFDARMNIEGGARYLRDMLHRFGSIAIALAAYNAGPGAVERARGIPRIAETRRYVRRVMARWQNNQLGKTSSIASSGARVTPPRCATALR